MAEKKTKTEKAPVVAKVKKKKSEAIDMSGLTKDELMTKARELQVQLFDLKIKRSTSQLENQSEIWKARKDLARAMTYLTQKSQSK